MSFDLKDPKLRFSVRKWSCFKDHYAAKVNQNTITNASAGEFLTNHEACTKTDCLRKDDDFENLYNWKKKATTVVAPTASSSSGTVTAADLLAMLKYQTEITAQRIEEQSFIADARVDDICANMTAMMEKLTDDLSSTKITINKMASKGASTIKLTGEGARAIDVQTMHSELKCRNLPG